MKILFLLSFSLLFLVACSQTEDTVQETVTQRSGSEVTFESPEKIVEPAYVEPKSETDWAAKVNNKEKEVIQVINIINPVAAYLTAGFEQYGSRIKNATLHEEWQDTQEQLTKALTLYDDCKKRKGQGKFDKQLFLDLEDTWQFLVKTGVAGTRTKSMLDQELQKL
jgi:hypothetical protein